MDLMDGRQNFKMCSYTRNNKSMSFGHILVFQMPVLKKKGGPWSWLALEGLAVLSVAQRSVSLLGDAATHASVK